MTLLAMLLEDLGPKAITVQSFQFEEFAEEKDGHNCSGLIWSFVLGYLGGQFRATVTWTTDYYADGRSETREVASVCRDSGRVLSFTSAGVQQPVLPWEIEGLPALSWFDSQPKPKPKPKPTRKNWETKPRSQNPLSLGYGLGIW